MEEKWNVYSEEVDNIKIIFKKWSSALQRNSKYFKKNNKDLMRITSFEVQESRAISSPYLPLHIAHWYCNNISGSGRDDPESGPGCATIHVTKEQVGMGRDFSPLEWKAAIPLTGSLFTLQIFAKCPPFVISFEDAMAKKKDKSLSPSSNSAKVNKDKKIAPHNV